MPDYDVEIALNQSFKTISEGANHSRHRAIGSVTDSWEYSHPRWKRLIENNDSRTIWKAINWKGDINEKDIVQPADEKFKLHFENLLNMNQTNYSEIQLDNCPYIPVLDDPFTLPELDTAIKDLKTEKGYTGVCPGLFVNLPLTWLIFFLTLFNVIFQNLSYPAQWTYSKLITLFKSGNRMDCGNYRGISIMDTLAKVYDKLLLNRLTLWSYIDKCQAGAQKGRGCIEQMLTLRLLMDLAKFKKRKLYILFIDFSKAYDRVPRNKLIEYMKSLGCGRVLLYAIQNMYKCTYNVLNSIKISTSSGVRQGAPTSCLLFIMYVDKMVKMIKEAVPLDGFLGRLHILMLMDDTVVMATNRDACLEKLDAVLRYCNEYGMEINAKKTKFFVINSEATDKISLQTQVKKIDYCEKYLYLGSWFTDDGKIESSLNLREPAHQDTLNKFAIFCQVNTEMPYYYKSLVMDAAAVSSIFYGCETWLTGNPKHAIKIYNQLIKCLLGVRQKTSADLCLVESGKPPAKELIQKRLKSFLEKKMHERDMEEPFQIVYNMCRNENSPGFKFLQKMASRNTDVDSLEKVSLAIRNNANATKFVTYCTVLNPDLSTHTAYGKICIPDYVRVSFTRLRVMSHNLKVETGRWSRLARENRVCQCDRSCVQDEKHVLLECPMSAPLRQRYSMLPFDSMGSLIRNADTVNTCRFIYDVLKIYN